MAVLKYYNEATNKYESLPLGVESVAVYDNGYGYSTEEQVIGCWTDGRPIYRKVIIDTLGTYSSGAFAYKYIAIGASIDSFVSVQGLCDFGDGGVGSFNTVQNEGKSEWLLCKGQKNTASSYPNSIQIRHNNSWYNGKTIIITIEYTKTTDAPNSFTLDMLSVGSLDTVATDDEVARVFE